MVKHQSQGLIFKHFISVTFTFKYLYFWKVRIFAEQWLCILELQHTNTVKTVYKHFCESLLCPDFYFSGYNTLNINF